MEKKTKTALIVLLVLLAASGAFLIFKPDSQTNRFVPEVIKEEPVRILFVGDIMLDRGVRIAINREGTDYPFGNIRELLLNADLTVGNLEGSVTDNDSVALPGSGVLRFTFDPVLLRMLKDYGFDGFSLANNHTLDFGEEGLQETIRILESADIFHFGSPSNTGKLSAVVERGEEELCFVGYHHLFNPAISPVINELNALVDTCTFTTVLAHWGEEYQDEENEHQRNIGRAFIDAGADLVIGHHPHVVQPVEIYKNKAIFYSLGNFLFDQDFSLETRQGLAVRLELTETEQKFHLIPTEMSRARLYYPEKEAYQPRFNILISKLPELHKTTADVESEFVLPRL